MGTDDVDRYTRPEVYDLAYSWHTHDIPFYVARAREARGAVLEVGCGTGRVLLPTLQAGVEIDGLDLRPGMIAFLKQKADERGLAPRLAVADMRDFTMPRRYALITIPFRAFQHLLTTADQIAALRCMREHLESGGALVFNVFFPSFEKLGSPDGEQVLEREFPHPATGLPVAMYVTRKSDRVNQVLHAEREVVESDARGYASATHRDEISMRWTWKPEMELLLAAAGFSRWSVAGGFAGEPLEQQPEEMVWTAWKD